LILLKLNKVIFRYIISGGTAACIDIFILYFLTSYLKVHYLLAAIFAFMVAFFVSFILQKFWTFKNNSKKNIHRQLTFYLIVSVTNLFLNTFLMYVFVDIIHAWYILAQIFSGGIIAMESFILYQYLIFRETA